METTDSQRLTETPASPEASAVLPGTPLPHALKRFDWKRPRPWPIGDGTGNHALRRSVRPPRRPGKRAHAGLVAFGERQGARLP